MDSSNFNKLIEIVSGSEEDVRIEDELVDNGDLNIQTFSPSECISVQDDINDITEIDPGLEIICLGETESRCSPIFNSNCGMSQRKRISKFNGVIRTKRSKFDFEVVGKGVISRCEFNGCDKPKGIDPVIFLNRLSQKAKIRKNNSLVDYSLLSESEFSEENIDLNSSDNDEGYKNGDNFIYNNYKNKLSYDASKEDWIIKNYCPSESLNSDGHIKEIDAIKSSSNDIVQISSDEEGSEKPDEITRIMQNNGFSNQLTPLKINLHKMLISSYHEIIQYCIISSNGIIISRPNSADCILMRKWLLSFSIHQANNFFILGVLLNPIYCTTPLSYFLNFDVQSLQGDMNLNRGLEILLYSSDEPYLIFNSISAFGYPCRLNALEDDLELSQSYTRHRIFKRIYRQLKRTSESSFYRRMIWPFIMVTKYVSNKKEEEYDAQDFEMHGEVLVPAVPKYAVSMETRYSPSRHIQPLEEAINCTGFTGNVVKLFTYPPPPATHGINVSNEDLFCLNDGEYLNDVIIDFYIKYLSNEIISQHDRERTHFFSSFFYSHLVSVKRDDTNELTYKEERHAKVKRWTRNVDIFSKDFIVIPINESFHWFLAIICFPNSRMQTLCRPKAVSLHNSPSPHDQDANPFANINNKLSMTDNTSPTLQKLTNINSGNIQNSEENCTEEANLITIMPLCEDPINHTQSTNTEIINKIDQTAATCSDLSQRSNDDLLNGKSRVNYTINDSDVSSYISVESKLNETVKPDSIDIDVFIDSEGSETNSPSKLVNNKHMNSDLYFSHKTLSTSKLNSMQDTVDTEVLNITSNTDDAVSNCLYITDLDECRDYAAQSSKNSSFNDESNEKFNSDVIHHYRDSVSQPVKLRYQSSIDIDVNISSSIDNFTNCNKNINITGNDADYNRDSNITNCKEGDNKYTNIADYDTNVNSSSETNYSVNQKVVKELSINCLKNSSVPLLPPRDDGISDSSNRNTRDLHENISIDCDNNDVGSESEHEKSFDTLEILLDEASDIGDETNACVVDSNMVSNTFSFDSVDVCFDRNSINSIRANLLDSPVNFALSNISENCSLNSNSKKIHPLNFDAKDSGNCEELYSKGAAEKNQNFLKSDGSNMSIFLQKELLNEEVENNNYDHNLTAPENPCILIFDSLKGECRYDIAQTLRDYLQLEWILRKESKEGPRIFDKNAMKGSMVNCPQQPNSYDCGLYVLQYVENFFREPIKDFLLPLGLYNWFSAREAMSKRFKLAQLILSLTKQLQPDLKYDAQFDGCLNIAPLVADSDDEDSDKENSSSEDENSSSSDGKRGRPSSSLSASTASSSRASSSSSTPRPSGKNNLGFYSRTNSNQEAKKSMTQLDVASTRSESFANELADDGDSILVDTDSVDVRRVERSDDFRDSVGGGGQESIDCENLDDSIYLDTNSNDSHSLDNGKADYTVDSTLVNFDLVNEESDSLAERKTSELGDHSNRMIDIIDDTNSTHRICQQNDCANEYRDVIFVSPIKLSDNEDVKKSEGTCILNSCKKLTDTSYRASDCAVLIEGYKKTSLASLDILKDEEENEHIIL